MKNLKSRLTSATRHLHPSPDAYSRTLAIIDRRARTRRVRAGIVGLGVAFILVGLVLGSLASLDGRTRNDKAGAAPSHLSVVAERDLGPDGALSSIAVSDGSLTVSDNDGSPHVLVLDGQRLNTISEITTPNAPNYTNGGGNLTVALGTVWLTGSDQIGDRVGAVLRGFDIESGSPTSTLELPGNIGVDVVASADSLWALTWDEPSGVAFVSKVSASDELLGQFEIPDIQPRALVAGPERLWVVGRDWTNPDQSTIASVSMMSGEVTSFHQTLTYPAFFAISDGRPVVLDNQSLRTFDVDGSPRDTLELSDSVRPPVFGADGWVWFAISGQDSGYSIAFMPADGSGELTSVAITGTPIALATSDNSAWVLTYEGTIVKLAVT